MYVRNVIVKKVDKILRVLSFVILLVNSNYVKFKLGIVLFVSGIDESDDLDGWEIDLECEEVFVILFCILFMNIIFDIFK